MTHVGTTPLKGSNLIAGNGTSASSRKAMRLFPVTHCQLVAGRHREEMRLGWVEVTEDVSGP